jgi:Rrf2 family protein
MSQLVDANIISSSKGREGGYTLTKEPNDIKLVDILEAVKECLHQTDCLLGIGACNEAKKCALHDQWLSPKKAILTMFKNTTLKEIVQGKIISL